MEAAQFRKLKLDESYFVRDMNKLCSVCLTAAKSRTFKVHLSPVNLVLHVKFGTFLVSVCTSVFRNH